jgi:hypothetical protein
MPKPYNKPTSLQLAWTYQLVFILYFFVFVFFSSAINKLAKLGYLGEILFWN